MMEAPSVNNATISSIAKPKYLIIFFTNSKIVSAYCEFHTDNSEIDKVCIGYVVVNCKVFSIFPSPFIES